MFFWLALLSLCISACTAAIVSCESYPSPEYRDVSMECSGVMVDRVPRLLPGSLKMLLLTGTAIPSLDSTTFQGLHFPELTTLYVTGGILTSVKANAFCPLNALTMLHLDSNRLHSLDEESFSCNKYLRTVSLVNNPRLHHLPRLVSTSVKFLYVDNCSLTSIDVATVERMTALETLSLLDNPDLHCASVEAKFKQARPGLQVICGDSAGDLPTSVIVGDQERTSEKSFHNSHSAMKNTTKYSTGVEELTSEKSFVEADFSIKNTQTATSGGEERSSEKSLNKSDSASKDTIKDSIADEERTGENSVNASDLLTNKTKKGSTQNSASCIAIFVVIAGISIVIIISILYSVYKRYSKITIVKFYQEVAHGDP